MKTDRGKSEIFIEPLDTPEKRKKFLESTVIHTKNRPWQEDITSDPRHNKVVIKSRSLGYGEGVNAQPWRFPDLDYFSKHKYF